jgi:hypothetical protein
MGFVQSSQNGCGSTTRIVPNVAISGGAPTLANKMEMRADTACISSYELCAVPTLLPLPLTVKYRRGYNQLYRLDLLEAWLKLVTNIILQKDGALPNTSTLV